MSADKREAAEQAKDPMMANTIKMGLDLKGGTHLLLEADTSKLDENVKVSDAVDRAMEVIRNRIDQFGVTEPMIARQGDKWIVVQLPGIKDPTAAKELLGKTALLEFRIVDDGKESTQALDMLREKGITADEFRANVSKYQNIAKLLPKGASIYANKDGSEVYVLQPAALTGSALTNAKVELGQGQFGAPHVSLEFNKTGAQIFADVTGKYIGRNLAIVLDNIVQSAPRINSRIPDGKAIIEGNYSADDAKFLANVLRAGALPVPVRIIEERTVGPSLGSDSIQKGFMAGIIGVIAVLLFMFIYYRTSGLIADFALVINLIFLMAIMAYFQFTLTLPGVAGIALTLAMAVDANVLIIERIREELNAGKTPRVAVDAGYQKVFWTIFDTHFTNMIAAFFLFSLGTGPIKGFAVTLFIGLIISIFTAIVVTKLVYDFLFKENLMGKFKI